MACNYMATNNFAHPLVGGSFGTNDNMLFGFYPVEGKLICSDDVDGDDVANDALGELREEEIVWGEAEMHHQHIDSTIGSERTYGKSGLKTSSTDRRAIRHCSLLSRQMEMQANTWTPGSTISAVFGAKQSAKGSVYNKAGPDDKDREVKAGGCEEEGGLQQHIDERIPPHELLARQYASSATSSFSVLHGAGRTLKGRDLRRLRNEVWRQTGFVD